MGVRNMATEIDPRLIPRARRLRRGMTDGERKLWSQLRQFRNWFGIHVRKQAPIGPYVAAFAIHEHGLIIEVDGEHHFTPEGLLRDSDRDGWFASQGYRVLRFNTDAFDGCVEEIMRALGPGAESSRSPTPSPSPQGGGGL